MDRPVGYMKAGQEVGDGLGLLGIHHLSFTVTDLARTVDFYKRLIGLELQYLKRNETEEGTAPGGRATTDSALMESKGLRVEFVQFIEPKVAPLRSELLGPSAPHLAFQVRDIHAAREYLEREGVEFLAPVQIWEGRNRMFCQFRDPDQYIVELIEEMPTLFQLREMAERIRRTRIERGLTVKTVAAESGMSGANLSQVERCQTIPSVTSLLNIARALNVSADYLLRPETDMDLLDRLVQVQDKARQTSTENGL